MRALYTSIILIVFAIQATELQAKEQIKTPLVDTKLEKIRKIKKQREHSIDVQRAEDKLAYERAKHQQELNMGIGGKLAEQAQNQEIKEKNESNKALRSAFEKQMESSQQLAKKRAAAYQQEAETRQPKGLFSSLADLFGF